MKVTTTDGKTFELERESLADHQLLDALDLARRAHTVRMVCKPATSESRLPTQNYSAIITVDLASPHARSDEAGSQALSALRQLFRLGNSQPANNGLHSALATNPQAQEQLAASLIELDLMRETFGDVIGQNKAVVEKLVSTHSDLDFVKNPIVAEGGAAFVPERLLRLPEVENRVRLGKSSIYEMMNRTPPAFPRPVKLSRRAVCWPASAIEAWIADRIKLMTEGGAA